MKECAVLSGMEAGYSSTVRHPSQRPPQPLTPTLSRRERGQQGYDAMPSITCSFSLWEKVGMRERAALSDTKAGAATLTNTRLTPKHR